MHAGFAAERVDTQARIVRERGKACGTARMARLGERVLEEGGVRLRDFGDPERRLGDKLDVALEQSFDLAQLARIVGRQHQLHFSAYSATQ